MKRILFTLPESLQVKLKKLKEKTGYTISDLIRQGLELVIKKYEI